MTDDQINIAIARSQGMEVVSDGITHCLTPCDFDGNYTAAGKLLKEVPNYCNNLNAIYEAEELLEEMDLMEVYEELLYETSGRRYLCRTNARQRAEAFLRVLGEWKDS